MKNLTGRAIAALLPALWLTCVTPAAMAEDYPNRIIKEIVPFAPGVSTDALARSLAQQLSQSLGQTVVAENRPGANGIIGATAVARAPADGYTFLITTGSHTANPHVTKELQYDALKDFAPITQLAQSYGLVLMTNLPVKSVAELVELGKQRPLSYAHSGIGNLTHVSARLFEQRAGIKMTAVPYSNPNLVTDVLSGTVDLTFISMITAVPLATGGQAKVLAITGPKRAPALPDIPTLQELGYKDYDLTGYFGIMFPAGVPRERVERVYRETKKALEGSQLKKLIEDSGLYTVGSTPDEFAAYLKQDYEYQGRLMQELGMKVN